MSPVTTTLSWVLAGAPASPPPEPATAEFVNEVAHVEMMFDDGKVRRSSSLARGVAGERARAMLDVLAQSDPQEGKVSCGLAILGTAIACAGSAALLPALGCATGTYEVVCHCAEFVGPKLPEDWC